MATSNAGAEVSSLWYPRMNDETQGLVTVLRAHIRTTPIPGALTLDLGFHALMATKLLGATVNEYGPEDID